MKNHNISFFALYTALAFIFSYIEKLIPIPMPVHGMKIGLANIILILALYQKGFPFALGVSLVRTALTAITFGNLFMFFFSIAGTILSLVAMNFVKNKSWFSIITTSALGGILHNTGQILVAMILLQGTAILSYFPLFLTVWSWALSRVLVGCSGRGKATSGLPARRGSGAEAGGKGSRLRSPTPCSVPKCHEHNFQHTLSSEELSGSQPACKAQGQAATMTVSIKEILGEPEEMRQVVSSAELSARRCGFMDGKGSSDCWEGLSY